MVSNYTHKTSLGSQYTEGAHRAESEAIGRLRELAEEYAGTEIGAEYERQWREATKTDTRYEAYYIHSGGSDDVVVVDRERGTATTLVVDSEVMRDFQAADPDWSNWHGRDVDFIERPAASWDFQDLEDAFGGKIVVFREDTQEPTVFNGDLWRRRQEFYTRPFRP